METLTIGQVSKLAGIGVDAIRFYERERLIPLPARRSSGYRQYQPEIIERILFINQAKELGFTLAEVNALLDLRYKPNGTATQVKEKALTKIADVDSKINRLTQIKEQILTLTSACSGKGPVKDCPIMNGIISRAHTQDHGQVGEIPND